MIDETEATEQAGDAVATSRPIADPGGVLRPLEPLAHSDLSAILDLPVSVRVVLGSAKISVSELVKITKGSTITLNRRIGDSVEVTVNDRPFARGEIVVINEDPPRFGIAIQELLRPGRGVTAKA